MLAEEMELLAIAIRDDQVSQQNAAIETLMLGLVHLPSYLENSKAVRAIYHCWCCPCLTNCVPHGCIAAVRSCAICTRTGADSGIRSDRRRCESGTAGAGTAAAAGNITRD